MIIVLFLFAILWGLRHYVHIFHEGEGVELSRSQPLLESWEDYCANKANKINGCIVNIPMDLGDYFCILIISMGNQMAMTEIRW